MGRHLWTAKARTHKEPSLLLQSSTSQRDIKDEKMRAVMIDLLPLAAVKALSPMELMVEEWETWKVEHGKNYGHGLLGSTGNSVGGGGSQTGHFWMKIWMENKAKIEKHNRLAHKGHKSYHLAMNQFGDLLHHEFTALMNGYQSRSKFNYTGTDVPLRGAKFMPPAHVTSLPDNVDWRRCTIAPLAFSPAYRSRTLWTAAANTATRAVTAASWMLPSSTSRTTGALTPRSLIRMRARMTSVDTTQGTRAPGTLASLMLRQATRTPSRLPLPPRDLAAWQL